MTQSRIGAQLFTLREYLKTPEDIAKSLKKVREIGYEAVQLSALGPIDIDELTKIIEGEGLFPCATHVGWDDLRERPQSVIDDHKKLGCPHVAIGSMPAEYRNEEGYRRFAKEASEVAGTLAEAGLTFSYHNHDFELERFGDQTGLEILVNESDSVLGFEIDTYWIQRGGGDPAAWIKKVKGRIPLVHFKDMAVQGRDAIMAEVGEGNLNWPAILDACKEAGVEWYLVEQDICQRDPFESLAISLRNLKEMGIE